jgi:adenylyltransferase/sulfurtransferase
VGSLKVEVAAERLREAFPSTRVKALPFRVDGERASSLFIEHDVIIDGTDDVESKFLLSQIAVRHRVPLVHGGVIRFEGQAMLIAPEGPCLRCLFEPTTRDQTTSCARAGVLGTVAGVIGATQAVLGLAALDGERNRYGRLIVFDGWKLSERAIAVSRAADCPICGRMAGNEPCHDPLLGAQ